MVWQSCKSHSSSGPRSGGMHMAWYQAEVFRVCLHRPSLLPDLLLRAVPLSLHVRNYKENGDTSPINLFTNASDAIPLRHPPISSTYLSLCHEAF